MCRIFQAVVASAVLAASTVPGGASDADFLRELAGQWSGGGEIRLKPEDDPVNVDCNLSSSSDESSVSMDGSCSTMIIMSREIGAVLEVDDGTYSGTYIGSTRGPATLSGTRSGNSVNLSVSWAETGRDASMTLSAEGGQMQIMTSEAHPETGEQVVTAQLSFQRQ